MEGTNFSDIEYSELLEVSRIYDPDLDDSIEEVYELLRDHNEITISAELNHLLTHV